MIFTGLSKLKKHAAIEQNCLFPQIHRPYYY